MEKQRETSVPLDKINPDDPEPNAEYIVQYAKEHAVKGDPDSVIEVADKFCSKYARRSMNVGSVKGRIVDALFKESNPDVALELGAFVGYSAVRMGRLLKPGGKLWSIEVDPYFASLSKELVDFAGLSDKVTFIIGSSELVIPKLKDYGLEKIDFVFIDHLKTLYKPDLLRLVENDLLQKNAIIAADNVLWPGAPDYLEYVRTSAKFESTFYESHLEFRPEVKDGIEKSVYLG